MISQYYGDFNFSFAIRLQYLIIYDTYFLKVLFIPHNFKIAMIRSLNQEFIFIIKGFVISIRLLNKWVFSFIDILGLYFKVLFKVFQIMFILEVNITQKS